MASTKNSTVTVTASFRWWLKPYLQVLCFFCLLHGRMPDQARLERVIRRGIRIEVTL